MKGCFFSILKFFGTFFTIVIIFSIIGVCTISDDDDEYESVEYQADNCAESSKEVQLTSQMLGGKSIQRSWIDYYPKDYCFKYNIINNAVSSSQISYNAYQPSLNWESETDAQFYGDVYASLTVNNNDRVKHVTDSLLKYAQNKNLDQLETAEMIVSFVQDIPYSYVFSDQPCSEREYKRYPCTTGKKFGLLTPVEFLSTLVGDCDTRSVLLYLILKQLNYDLGIVISREYAHAMIAINLPYNGDYIVNNQKKYYFWETTATGWIPGALPPHCNNKDYWTFALI